MARCGDSRSVWSVQPHHVTILPSCAFLQLMGALMHARKKVMMVTCCDMLCRQSSANRSSTYNHARWLKKLLGVRALCGAFGRVLFATSMR